jgi:type IV secretion system protein VirB3
VSEAGAGERRVGRALAEDILFVALTRPAVRWGVTYTALLLNGVVTLNVFLFSGNLLTLLLCLPVHGVCALLCARDARIFDLCLVWGRTGCGGWMANRRRWGCAS